MIGAAMLLQLTTRGRYTPVRALLQRVSVNVAEKELMTLSVSQFMKVIEIFFFPPTNIRFDDNMKQEKNVENKN